MNYQSDLEGRIEVAGVDLQVARGKKDLTAKMRMIPAQSLQTVQRGVRGRRRNELREALLVFLRKDKAGAHGVFAWERPASKDAHAAGLLDAE